MKPSVKNIHLNSLLFKIISLVFGYSFWLILAQNQNIDMSINVPISFFELNEGLEVHAPEYVKVTFNARRSDFNRFDVLNESLHINLSHINDSGEYNIQLLPEHILLHNKIKLLNYVPSSLNIRIESVTKKIETQQGI